MLTNICGISENRIAPYISEIFKEGQALVITTSTRRAQRIATDLAFFCDAPICILPEFDVAGFKYEAKSRSDLDGYLKAYSTLLSGKDCIVIAPVLSALKKLQPKDAFLRHAFSLKTGAKASREDIISNLVLLGYERLPIAEASGQFAVRGDIIDIFSSLLDAPVRIELFDDEIDSIRSYDSKTQRSVCNLPEANIYPANPVVLDDVVPEIAEALDNGVNSQYLENYINSFYSKCDYIWNYMTAPSLIAIDDPSRIGEVIDFFEKEISEMNSESSESLEKTYPCADDMSLLNTAESKLGTFYFTPFAQTIRFTDRLDKLEDVNAMQAPVFNGHLELFASAVRDYESKGYDIVIACAGAERCDNLKEYLQGEGLGRKVRFAGKPLSSGTVFPDKKIVYLTDSEIFKAQKRAKRKHQKGQQIKLFTDINKGDYVVHDIHGIGQFVGVVRLTVEGNISDYLKICYDGSDVLYIPVDEIGSIQKYIGGEGTQPKLSKLSGGDWQTAKTKAKESIRKMAEEFIKASAKREIAKGFEFGPDSAWQKEFEDSFPFAETEDQLRCSEEIKSDMQSQKAMDRLLCGDVGYGKTEVAARAVFKALEHGKQVAVLVPTTILASQHYHTFSERLAGYPFEIEMLSRFRTDAQQKKIIRDLEKGDVDLVIGTHRLLSSDVKFKDLGLLVVDEEQRFGVEHKEAIKQLKSGVDVLTLSATPIPRTLHMSLIGVRDMSVIEEPPEDRYPVQTYVTEQDDKLIADAIRREAGRGGQVYLVYNRVRGIISQAKKIQSLVPELSIAVAHGQMNETELEDIMIDFQSGKYDVLVSTTIIESGLDIPNVNTLIVLDADRFGLSQLYQLRGRVGRSNRMAYAYLMYKKDKVLTELAEKRLRAIKEFTEFGSGFRVAMRDLELRGAGNLLGVEQSGHMLSIGYEMYCRLVDEAIAELKGENVESRLPESDTSVELNVSAFLPEEYIADEITRLDLYKRIASVSSEEDKSEMYDELLDRFGEPPFEANALLDIAMIRNKAARLGIAKIVKQLSKLVLLFDEKNSLTPGVLSGLYEKYNNAFSVYAAVKPKVSLSLGKGFVVDAAVDLIETIEELSKNDCANENLTGGESNEKI